MILGIGIDSVEIERFHNWAHYSSKSLTRIFSKEEINYCLNCPPKSAERFAARFAVREALYKALRQAYPELPIPFLSLCKLIILKNSAQESPTLSLENISTLKKITVKVSWTHTSKTASAIVLIQNQ